MICPICHNEIKGDYKICDSCFEEEFRYRKSDKNLILEGLLTFYRLRSP